MAANIAELRKQSSGLSNPFEALLQQSVRFDPDAWHVMQERDEQLIRDAVLHGTIIKDYIYEFSIKGQKVTGISVVGARQLACEYKGIKSRIVASADKTGSMFVFRSFDPMNIHVQHIEELAAEPDYYECIVEVSDIKTGNSIQVRKKEFKVEKKRDGGTFERPHYDVIAESKAFRNGVLSIIPQSVIAEFEQKALKAGNASHEKTIGQLRENLMAYATKQGIKLDRGALSGLTYAELAGIGSAAKASLNAFKAACHAAGLISESGEIANSENVDQATGEILDAPREETASQSVAEGPSIKDALQAVEDKDFELARDIARGLPDEDRRRVEAEIAKAQRPAAQNRRQQAMDLE
jgi:hypothetical protein